jgi:hypothetical protein
MTTIRTTNPFRTCALGFTPKGWETTVGVTFDAGEGSSESEARAGSVGVEELATYSVGSAGGSLLPMTGRGDSENRFSAVVAESDMPGKEFGALSTPTNPIGSEIPQEVGFPESSVEGASTFS